MDAIRSGIPYRRVNTENRYCGDRDEKSMDWRLGRGIDAARCAGIGGDRQLYVHGNHHERGLSFWTSRSGGQRAFYQGLGGFVDTSISGITGLRELRVSGDTIVDYGFFKARSGYQLIVNSAAFTADYTLPGVYTDANAQLNLLTGYNVSFIQTIIPITGATDSRTTYLHLDKLVVMNSDYPPLVPTVPLPASLPLLGTALAVLGFMGSGMRRAAIVRADRVICA
jgi:hypothetical protein